MKRIAALAGALLLGCLGGSCGASSGPVTVHLYGLDPSTGQYGYFDARLETLDDLTEMRGRVVAMRGGAEVVADALVAINDPKDPRSLRAEGGGPPACEFDQQGGVLHPRDFDSLAMASAYWALERARGFYEGLGGVAPGELHTLNAYYDPRFQAFTKIFPTFWFMTDNAAYAPPFDGFLIVPHLVFQDVPFFTNLGVLTHEYGHKVHNHLVEHDARVPHWRTDDWTLAASNQIRGVDEGLSDVFGGTITGDSDYIGPSVVSQPGLIDRDMAKVRVMSAGDVTVSLSGQTDYDPHKLGAFVAATLWQLGLDVQDHTRVAKAVLATERAMGAQIAAKPKPFDYSVLGFFNLFAAQLDASDRKGFCALVDARFAQLEQNDPAHRFTCPSP